MHGLYIGLMSGTSADGIDAVLVEFDKEERFHLIGSYSWPYQDHFRTRLLALALNDQVSLSELGQVSTLLAEQSAKACHLLLKQCNVEPSQVIAIGSHGHTIDHAPSIDAPYSMQIGNHAALAERTLITTISDFRSRDIAAGGQGAPLVPAFHQWLFKSCDANSAIINIGGISNITVLHRTDSVGYDIGPGNCLLDSWHQLHTGEYFDHSGENARLGEVIPELLQTLLDDDFFNKPAPKSTGREYFNLDWLNQKQARITTKATIWHNVARTLLEFSAQVIANCAQAEGCERLFICGGGTHNQFLVERIAAICATKNILTDTTETLGLDPDWVEAAAFAWLAYRTKAGLSGNLPSATGARGYRILGAIYPA